MLVGMAATFAIVATLAAVGGGWAVQANEVGRWAALLLLALFGIALVFPGISDRLTRPLVALGSRMSERDRAAGQHLVVGRARRRDRAAVGAVRRADPRHHLHRRGAQRRELQHDFAARSLMRSAQRPRWPRAAGRRQGVRAHEEVARRQRAHPPGAWRAGAGRRRRHRARPRHARAFEAVERADRELGNRPRAQARREPADG